MRSAPITRCEQSDQSREVINPTNHNGVVQPEKTTTKKRAAFLTHAEAQVKS